MSQARALPSYTGHDIRQVKYNFLGVTIVSIGIHQLIIAECRRLGARSVRVDGNGGAKHPKIVARFGERVLTFSAPRGNIRESRRGHHRQNYITATRRRVRAFLRNTI
jgi:hypothetical protein